MTTGRIVIIPFLHGKLTVSGTLIEPDIHAILKKWLERHPEYQGLNFHVIRAKTHLTSGRIETDLVRVPATHSRSRSQVAYAPCPRPGGSLGVRNYPNHWLGERVG